MSILLKKKIEVDLLAVRAEREQLKAELAKLESEMAGYLKAGLWCLRGGPVRSSVRSCHLKMD